MIGYHNHQFKPPAPRAPTLHQPICTNAVLLAAIEGLQRELEDIKEQLDELIDGQHVDSEYEDLTEEEGDTEV